MTFEQAAATVMPFGRNRGRTLDEIAETDDGLRYLDWVMGWDKLHGTIKVALQVYLLDQAIADEVERAVQSEDSRESMGRDRDDDDD
jgi:hypothetical protein